MELLDYSECPATQPRDLPNCDALVAGGVICEADDGNSGGTCPRPEHLGSNCNDVNWGDFTGDVFVSFIPECAVTCEGKNGGACSVTAEQIWHGDQPTITCTSGQLEGSGYCISSVEGTSIHVICDGGDDSEKSLLLLLLLLLLLIPLLCCCCLLLLCLLRRKKKGGDVAFATFDQGLPATFAAPCATAMPVPCGFPAAPGCEVAMGTMGPMGGF